MESTEGLRPFQPLDAIRLCEACGIGGRPSVKFIEGGIIQHGVSHQSAIKVSIAPYLNVTCVHCGYSYRMQPKSVTK